MQLEFQKDRARAQLGQKLDATAALVVSSTSSSAIPFGALVVFGDIEVFFCKLPTTKAHVEKPLGITLRQLHSEDYQPKTSIAVLRKGRVWIDAEKVTAPGDSVYIRFDENGSAKFTSDKEKNILLRGAIFLEKSDGGLTPIEVDFFGGEQ